VSGGGKKDDYEVLKRYLDKKLRIGKLDSALLSISSSLSLLFGCLQWFLGGVQALIFFSYWTILLEVIFLTQEFLEMYRLFSYP